MKIIYKDHKEFFLNVFLVAQEREQDFLDFLDDEEKSKILDVYIELYGGTIFGKPSPEREKEFIDRSKEIFRALLVCWIDAGLSFFKRKDESKLVKIEDNMEKLHNEWLNEK